MWQKRAMIFAKQSQLEDGVDPHTVPPLTFPETRHDRNQSARADQAPSGAAVDLAAALPELLGLFPEPLRDRGCLLRDAVLGGVVADVLGDLHRAEVRPAHRAEVGDL